MDRSEEKKKKITVPEERSRLREWRWLLRLKKKKIPGMHPTLFAVGGDEDICLVVDLSDPQATHTHSCTVCIVSVCERKRKLKY